ncbi:MTAP family purine nucleoside phosphorylase [Candidatus Halobonum tyrrellensis]|uniref:Purine nucleoside phosphorylase n=1 Tax=Candidatus Halobonum tyrrellensis G22 TaxID=1324957 RepID=V4H9U8_9EURY|nr:MTAP family purine nucleoside phosphorylase [Candidatus Halobonum tyrrellensis]ESP87470.1 methylthioadenosine phosphorylase [Candidatus Halobonum tyrrellensis G22]
MTIGFIGGSGIYEALPLSNTRTEDVTTPFGDPSAPLEIGEFGDSEARSASGSRTESDDTGREVVFLPRHGPDHGRSPTDLPYRANIYALKQAGVEYVLASNAVGSLREDLPPRTLVVPDQIYDRTKRRDLSFYGDGVVVHQGFARPYSPALAAHLADAAREATDADVNEGGTYVCIEGPQFSTEAESEFYRSQGWDVVGMTAIPEAKLAREAEMAYATLAGVTDYDVWKADSEVSLGEVLDNAAANETAIKETVERAIETFPDDLECEAHGSLEGTINTPTEAIPDETRARLEPLIGDYLD